jgi:5-hydroxyisourate hydrolase
MASPITCHVLNTLSGTPASGLKATLSLLPPTTSAATTDASFSARTNEDGRVKEWEPRPSTEGTVGENKGKSLAEVMDGYAPGERVAWSIRFEVGPWYEERGVESFWPEVEVKFYVKKGERHYHVPVLVGPWTYTTYRGS